MAEISGTQFSIRLNFYNVLKKYIKIGSEFRGFAINIINTFHGVGVIIASILTYYIDEWD